MNRKMTFAIALTLSLTLSLIIPPATALGQQQAKYRADSGVQTPRAGQLFRVTVTGGQGNDIVKLRFRWMRYMGAGCNGDVCRQTVASQGVTGPVELGANEAASFQLQGTGDGVRIIVESNTAGDRVVFYTIDADTLIISAVILDVTGFVGKGGATAVPN